MEEEEKESVYRAGCLESKHEGGKVTIKTSGAIIGDSVKTGINSSFSPGVSIGANSTIGSGVLLYKDVPADTMVLVNQEHILKKKKSNQMKLDDK